MGGWGGVIAGAALGGVSGVGSAMYADQVEKDKEEAQRLRDERLADLTRQNQIAVHKATTDIDTANIPVRQKALSDAAAATAEQDAATASVKITAEGKAKAKLELDPEVQQAEQAKALTTAKGQAAASKYIEENRTPEQQKKANLELDKIAAQISKERAEAGAAGAHAKYYGIIGEVAKKNAETKADAVDAKADAQAAKEDKWIVDKSNPAKWYGPGGLIRVEVTPEQMPVPAKESNFLGLGGRDAKPYVPPVYQYSTSNGTPVSYAEVAKVAGGKAEDYAKLSGDKPSTIQSGPIKAPGAVPPGYTPTGKFDKATGKPVYLGPDGEKYIQ